MTVTKRTAHAVAIATLAFLFIVSVQDIIFADGSLVVPDAATARTLDGKTASLADYRGKLVFLTVWKTDCPACLFEIPSLNMLHKNFSGEDFAIIGLSLDRNKDAFVKKVVEAREIAYPVWLGYGRPMSIYFGTDAFPTLFVIGPGGELLRYKIGAFESYDDALNALKQARTIVKEKTDVQ